MFEWKGLKSLQWETIFKSGNGSGKSDEKTKNTIADKNGERLHLDQRISDWFRCNSCDYESEEKNKLDVHIANLHRSSDKLKCKICNSEFTNDQLLENHTNDIHLKTKHFSCGICSYKSFYNQNLRRHISAQHKDKKRYFCNLCGFKSYYSCNVKSHITSNHKKSKLAKVKKTGCGNCKLDIEHRNCTRVRQKEKEVQSAERLNEKYRQTLKCMTCKFETNKKY